MKEYAKRAEEFDKKIEEYNRKPQNPLSRFSDSERRQIVRKRMKKERELFSLKNQLGLELSSLENQLKRLEQEENNSQ